MRKLYLFLLVAVVIFSACRKEEPVLTETSGSLILDVGLHLHIDEVSNGLKSTEDPNDFRVIIYSGGGAEVMSFDTYLSMPDTLSLSPGEYYVVAHSDNDLPAVFENPYYYGVSENFNIYSNTYQSVVVNCTLANTIVSVSYSDTLSAAFTDYSTTIYSGQDSLVYIRDETRWGYFHPSPLEITVRLNYLNPDGSNGLKILQGNIPLPEPGLHYQVRVNASPDLGSAGFQVFQDDSEAPVEIIRIRDDSLAAEPGAIGYGDLIITEIMANPSALSDTEGEWLEIYNASSDAVSLQNLVLQRDDINSHTIPDDIVLQPGDYYVLARTATATDAINTYVYGSDILLPNTGGILSIYNEGNETMPGSLIFEVDYGGALFPAPTGASICLEPGRLNASDAAVGSSWCTSSSVYNTGDLGTPAAQNDVCM